MTTISNNFFLDQHDQPVSGRFVIVRKWAEHNSEFLEIYAPHDGGTYLFNFMGTRASDESQYSFLRLPAPLSDGNDDYLIVFKEDPPDGLYGIGKEELAVASRLWNDL